MIRLWAGSADYHVDVRCSDKIFKQLSQNYLKFRNTARYCLGNLAGLTPMSWSSRRRCWSWTAGR